MAEFTREVRMELTLVSYVVPGEYLTGEHPPKMKESVAEDERDVRVVNTRRRNKGKG